MSSLRFPTSRLLCALLALGLVAQARGQTSLKWQFGKGDKLNYSMEVKMETAMNFMGMEQNMEMTQIMDMSWDVRDVDDQGSATMTQTITRFRYRMEGIPAFGDVEFDSDSGEELQGPLADALGPVFKALVGSQFTLRMNPQGVSSDVKVPESLAQAVRDIPGAEGLGFSEDNLKQMVSQSGVIFPNKPVTQGEKWSHASEVKTPFAVMRTENDLEYLGSETKDGATLEKIGIRPKISMEADPNNPIPIQVDLKEQEATGTVRFDNAKGRMVSSELKQKMRMELGVNNNVFEQKIDQTTTVKLNPAK